MPTFHNHSTAVQLSVANIPKVITQNPQPGQCAASTTNIKHVELEFAKASGDGTLAEDALSGDDGKHLDFLGKHQDMPFFMVRVGKDFYNPNATQKTTRRPAKSVKAQISDSTALYDGVDQTEEAAIISKALANEQDPLPIEPHALCLTVFLSKDSFSQVIYKNRMKTNIKHDIKIDVYFNGQLLNSQIMSHGQFHIAGPRGMKVRMHRFTGQRLNRYAEKPWIFVPPDSPVDERTASIHTSAASPASIQAPAKNANQPNLDAIDDADQRWKTVASGLLREAGRAGRDKHGNRPPSGEYLESLASLSAPPQLRNMQKTGVRKFGVIDVVIIWGKGQKDGPDSKYLTAPTPLRLNGYSAKNVDATSQSQSTTQLVSAGQVNSKAFATAPRLNGKEVEPIKSATPTLKQLHHPKRNRYGTLSSNTPTRQLPLTPNATKPSTRRTTPKRSRDTSLSLESSKPKRQRMPYFDTFTTKLTQEEETAAIVEQAKEDAHKLTSGRNLLNPNPYASTVASQPTSAPAAESQLETPKPSRIVSLKVSPQRLTSSTEGLAKQAGDASTNLFPQEPILPFNPLNKNHPSAVAPTPQGPTSNPAASSANSTPAEPMPASSHSRPGATEAQAVAQSFDLPSNPLDNSHASTVLTTQQGPTSNPAPSFAGNTPAEPIPASTVLTTPQAPTPNPTASSAISTPAEPTPASSIHRPYATKAQIPTHSFDFDFVPPALSADCCITFAERGVVRTVGFIRGGWFEEKGILMGTRFIVG